jgi:hypothetical protein
MVISLLLGAVALAVWIRTGRSIVNAIGLSAPGRVVVELAQGILFSSLAMVAIF